MSKLTYIKHIWLQLYVCTKKYKYEEHMVYTTRRIHVKDENYSMRHWRPMMYLHYFIPVEYAKQVTTTQYLSSHNSSTLKN